MERLTIRNSDGSVSQPLNLRWSEALEKLAAYEDTGLTPEDIDLMVLCAHEDGELLTIAAHINELFKAESEGRLIVLPCKTDDVVFVPLMGRAFPFDVISIICHNNKPTFKAQHGMHLVWVFGSDDIGKTVFLTREEAEAALKGGGRC